MSKVDEAWAALGDDIDAPSDDIVAAGVTGEAFVAKHRSSIESAIRDSCRAASAENEDAALGLRAAIAAIRNRHRQGDLHNYGWNDAVTACLHAFDEALAVASHRDLATTAMAAAADKLEGAMG